MPLITTSTHLSICSNCSGHAQVILADGTKSDHFATKSRGHAIVARMLLRGEVTREESDIVDKQIDASPLISNNVFIDAVCDELNGMKIKENFGHSFNPSLN